MKGTISRNVSQTDLLKVIDGICSRHLARTLAACLYWSQYATQHVRERPTIWKTGNDLSVELQLAARTVNAHLKALADLGFWDLEYHPRPRHPSPVSWLIFSERSIGMIAKARLIRSERDQAHRFKRHPRSGSKGASSHVQTSVPLTSKLDTYDQQTAKKQENSFLLSKEAGKSGMKEALSSFQGSGKKKGKDTTTKAPQYANASVEEVQFVTAIQTVLSDRNLPTIDWSSSHTWAHLKEVKEKLAKLGMIAPDDQLTFFVDVLDRWDWLRSSMAHRYSSNLHNLHRPSPMALNHQLAVLFDAVVKSKASPNSVAAHSNLDDDTFS